MMIDNACSDKQKANLDEHYVSENHASEYRDSENFIFLLPYRFIQLCLVLFIGIGIGYLYFIVFTNYSKACSISYVSNQEIILLEKERISSQPNDEKKELFFGKTDEALMLIEKIARDYENKNTKVIFVADKFVKGKDVTSISYQLHKTLIEILSKQRDKTPK